MVALPATKRQLAFMYVNIAQLVPAVKTYWPVVVVVPCVVISAAYPVAVV